MHGVIYKPWFYLSLWLRGAEQTHLNMSVRLQAPSNTSGKILSTAIKTLDQWNRKKIIKCFTNDSKAERHFK